MLATTGESFEDMQRHYRQIAVVSPTYYWLGRDLSIAGQDDPLVTGWARLRGIVVEPRVESQDPAILHTLLASAANRTNLIGRISGLVASNGYDGINIDFEAGAAADRPLLTAFIEPSSRRRCTRRARRSRWPSRPRPAPVLTGPRRASTTTRRWPRSRDRLFVMAWDLHWATSPAGAISDVTWVAKIINYIKTRPERLSASSSARSCTASTGRSAHARRRSSGTT